MMRCWILNTPELRDALDAANRTARLGNDQWRALLGLRVRLEAALVKQRRAALKDAELDAGICAAWDAAHAEVSSKGDE
jgi:hypothetical protein